jgi:hypothetical protein
MAAWGTRAHRRSFNGCLRVVMIDPRGSALR